MTTPTQVLIEVVRVLEDLQIPYVVVGSFASSARGVRRATIDADIVAQLSAAHVERIVEKLSSQDFYIDELAVQRAVALGRAFNAIHRESMFKVDVYVAHDDFSKKEIDRKLAEKILPDSETFVYISTSEDTVVAKLLWFRKGGEVSDRQWSDVLGVLKVQGARLDYEYMKGWADRLKIRDLLEKALAEVM